MSSIARRPPRAGDPGGRRGRADAGLLPPVRPLPNAGMPFRLHLVVSLLAYSLFTIASLRVLLMQCWKTALHGISAAAAAAVPPLLTMERCLFRTIGVGFALLTLALQRDVFFGRAVRQAVQLRTKWSSGYSPGWYSAPAASGACARAGADVWRCAGRLPASRPAAGLSRHQVCAGGRTPTLRSLSELG